VSLRSKLVTILVLYGSLFGPTLAFAADTASGDIFGEVIDASNSKPVADAIVVVESPSLQGEQTAISDDKGRYRISTLPPGVYTVHVTAPTFKNFELGGITLLVGRDIKVKIDLLPEILKGEEIVVKKQVASIIDQGSTTSGATLTRDYLEKVATTRTFESVTEAAPGAQTDRYGVSFNGATSPENAVFIDGVNAADPGVGKNGTTLPLEFLEQVEVKTNGFAPEYGNSTGAVVNVITKIGGNEFHGTVFNYITPLRLKALPVLANGTSVSLSNHLNYIEEFGFEVGGPIVKDYLWFHVGFAPRLEQDTLTRTFDRLEDDGNGNYKKDPKTGLILADRIPGTDHNYNYTDYSYAFTAKLTLNPNENNRITVGFSGRPEEEKGAVVNPGGGLIGVASGGAGTVTGVDASILNKYTSGGYDLAANYDGKFLNKKFLINAVVGYHLQNEAQTPLTADGNKIGIQYVPTRNLDKFEPNLASQCEPDIGTDPNTGKPIYRCPVQNYNLGGIGFLQSAKKERISARLNFTGLFSLAGSHQFKFGGEFQQSRYFSSTHYTGDSAEQIREKADGSTYYQDYRRYGAPRDPSLINLVHTDDPRLLNDNNVNFYSKFNNDVGFENYVGYVQDSWTILDKVNINGGVRLDGQLLHGGDPTTGGISKVTLIKLTNWSPRVGLIYDFTGTGRSKIFGSWGRFYELVPLDIMQRNFPPESQITTRRTICSDTDPLSCPGFYRKLTAASGDLIYQPLKGQFVDNWQAGFEYQILDDLLVGFDYTNSRLGTIIEDVSSDDGTTYFIANPSQGKATALATSDPVTGVAITAKLPKPERRYDAVNIYLNKALHRNFIVNATYTWSMLRGNLSGLFRPDDNQLDPNINSDYDLVSLLPNTFGLLASDRTHVFKLDGAYIIQVSSRFFITPNVIFRIGSGTPYSYTGAHPTYGAEQAFILARGSAGRTPPLVRLDAGLSFDYGFTKSTHLQLGLTVNNLINYQEATRINQRFVKDDDPVRPIIGGDTSDLKHLKGTDGQPVSLNGTFGSAQIRAIPAEFRFNAKLTF